MTALVLLLVLLALAVTSWFWGADTRASCGWSGDRFVDFPTQVPTQVPTRADR